MKSELRKKIRLLLVDDEEHFRSTLAKRLGKRGITARQAASGEACLEILVHEPQDVVVLDVKMPGLSGIETLNRIKETYAATEVILLTGHAATRDGVEGIKSGAFDYLAKPVEFDHLLGKIIQAYDKILSAKREKEAARYRARVKQQMIATERLAALGTLAAGVAHEINNPLAIINEAAGYLTLLLKKKELMGMAHKAAFEKALQKIDASVDRARSITHQLLGSVRKSEAILDNVNPVELVEETVQLIRREARDRDIRIDQRAAPGLKTIWVDPNQLRQVLINLLSNAIQASPPGSSIRVELKPHPEGISIAVADTGEGIPREHLEKIFEPFFSTKAPGEGTGLGLFVTRELIEKMSGNLKVDSRLGHGTRFTVQIPNQRSA